MIQETTPTPQQHDTPTVLIVDDEQLMRGVLTDLLQEGGLQTIPAASIDEAKAWLKTGTVIDLVFDDIRMPSADSFALAHWIHDNCPGLPLILANGHGGQIDGTQIPNDTHVLHKPCDFEMIVTTIRETIAHAQAPKA